MRQHMYFCSDEMHVKPACVPLTKASQMAKPKTSGVGVILCLEKENEHLWTNDTVYCREEVVLEPADRELSAGASTSYWGCRQPWSTRKGLGEAMPQAQLLPPSSIWKLSLCLYPLHPRGSQRQESFFCIFTGQFPRTESRVENVKEWLRRGRWRRIWFLLKGMIIWFIIWILTLQKMYHKHLLKTSDSSFLNNLGGIPGWQFIKLKWGKN